MVEVSKKSTLPETRQHMSKTPRIIWSFAALFLCVIPLVAGCSTKSRHRTILYDEGWSNDAAVKNLICVADLRVSCEREARVAEQDFSKKLPAAFRSTPECRTVGFMPLTPDAVHSHSDYWRLRVDFHPRQERQTFDLGPGTDRPMIGGDDVDHQADYICKAVKNNGVTEVW
jgi:hypothetical protein